jgi:hypothetical protein
MDSPGEVAAPLSRGARSGRRIIQALPQAEHSLKSILGSDACSEASTFMHLLGERSIRTLFRFSEFISPTPVDKRMFQLVMQDETRHVCYGLQHLK